MLIIFAPEALYIMGGKPYLVALYVMPPVACGCIFQFLYTMFVNVEQFSKKTIGMAFASASAAILNYVLNAIFIPRYGFIAAAYTTLAGFAWLLLSHMLLVFVYKLHEVYPYKIVFAAAGGSLVLTLGVNYLYDAPVLRYVLGGLYTIALICGIIKNKDVFIQLVKGKKNV